MSLVRRGSKDLTGPIRANGFQWRCQRTKQPIKHPELSFAELRTNDKATDKYKQNKEESPKKHHKTNMKRKDRAFVQRNRCGAKTPHAEGKPVADNEIKEKVMSFLMIIIKLFLEKSIDII